MKRATLLLALLLCLLPASAGARPIIAVDTLQWDATVSSGFTLSGWAADLSSTSGTGIGALDVWAFPASGAPVPLGMIRLFFDRPDVAAAFGSQFLRSGYRLQTAALSPGQYMVVLYPYSVAKGGVDFDAVAVLRLSVAGSTTTTLKVVSWNTHHGTDTAGVCSVDRIVDWIVRMGANVAALNEVEKGSGWCNGMDQPAQYLSLLRAKTGKTWYASFAQRDGNTYGQGNLVLSLFPLEAAEGYQLSGSRSVARAQLLVNGIRVNVYATHLDNASASLRMTEVLELKNWADNYPEQRIVAGDFNAWDGAPEILNLMEQYFDAWRVARAAGTAIAYSGNTGGATKGGARIDYIFHSRAASRLTLTQARVFDIVQSNGVSPSDHRPVLAVFEVR